MADGAVCVPTPRSEASPPPPSCLCVYTPLRHVCGAGTADRSSGAARGPRFPWRSVQPLGDPSWARSPVCVSVRQRPGYLERGSCGSGPADTLGLRVRWFAK